MRWSWVLIPYPILPQPLINDTVSVDVKHHEKRRPNRWKADRWGLLWQGALVENMSN